MNERKRYDNPEYMPSPEQWVDKLSGPKKGPQPVRPARAPRKRHPKRWIGLITLLILVGIISYGVYIASILAKISTSPSNIAPLSSTNGRTNILILGEGDPGHAGEDLTDTILLISYDHASGRLAEISIPRDLRVTVPGYGVSKINAANADGGSALAAQTVSNTLAQPINYTVTTNFSGLQRIVDAVGGIDVDVATKLSDPSYPCADNQYKSCGLDIEPGLQHMDGATALEYVRCRKGTCGNDFGRAARQQQVIGLIRSKLSVWQLLLHPAQLTALATAGRQSLSTDMGSLALLEFAHDFEQGSKRQPIHLVFSTATGGYLIGSGSSSDLLPQDGTYAAMQSAVANIFSSQPEPTPTL